MEKTTGLAIEKDGSLTFPVRVVPGAKKNEIVRVEGGVLRVLITAPPVGGKANEGYWNSWPRR